MRRGCFLMVSLFSAFCKSVSSTWSTPNDLGLRSKCGVVASAKDEGRGPDFTPAMLRSGVSAGLAWYTDWGKGDMAQGFSLSDYGKAKSLPQFWGPTTYQFDKLQAPNVPIMLGFNEPDMDHAGGSNIDVQKALNLWMENVANAKKQGYKLFVAPSIAKALPDRYTGHGEGSEWLPNFLQLCLNSNGCSQTIDFLGFHMYEPNCPTSADTVREWNVNRVLSLKKLAEEFNGKGMNIKGLWLTEFAGRSESSGKCRTQEQQKGWMRVIMPMLNEEPALVGYSWFSYGEGRSPHFSDNANLWNYNDGTLNDLGKTYFKLCGHFDGDDAGGSSWWIYLLVALVLLALLGVFMYFFWDKLGLNHCNRSCEPLVACRNCWVEMCRRAGVATAVSSHASGAQSRDVDLGLLRSEQPALVNAVDDCRELLKNPERFANESERVFSCLRRNIASCPPDSLDNVPAKTDIWRFICQVGESRRIYRHQANTLAKTLDARTSWANALNSDPELAARRRALHS